MKKHTILFGLYCFVICFSLSTASSQTPITPPAVSASRFPLGGFEVQTFWPLADEENAIIADMSKTGLNSIFSFLHSPVSNDWQPGFSARLPYWMLSYSPGIVDNTHSIVDFCGNHGGWAPCAEIPFYVMASEDATHSDFDFEKRENWQDYWVETGNRDVTIRDEWYNAPTAAAERMKLSLKDHGDKAQYYMGDLTRSNITDEASQSTILADFIYKLDGTKVVNGTKINQMGDQHLYDLTITSFDLNGSQVDQLTQFITWNNFNTTVSTPPTGNTPSVYNFPKSSDKTPTYAIKRLDQGHTLSTDPLKLAHTASKDNLLPHIEFWSCPVRV